MNAPHYACTFLRHTLRRPGTERAVAAVDLRCGRFVEIAFFIDGGYRGGSRIGAEGAPIVARAIDCARAGRATRQLGSFRDGRFTLAVRVGPHPSGGAAVYFQKLDEAGLEAGAPIALYGQELEALDAGLAWLAEAQGQS